ILLGGQLAHGVGERGALTREPDVLLRYRIDLRRERGDLDVLLRNRRLIIRLLVLDRLAEVGDRLLVLRHLSNERRVVPGEAPGGRTERPRAATPRHQS